MGVGEKQIMAALDDVVQSVRSTDNTVQSTWREFKPRIIRKFFRDGGGVSAADSSSSSSSSSSSADNNDDKIAGIYSNNNSNGVGGGVDEVELVGKSSSGDNSPFVWDVEVFTLLICTQIHTEIHTVLLAYN